MFVLYFGILCISLHVTSAQLECYHCNATVTDYHMCTTTMLCGTGEVCMRRQLNSLLDGHHEYHMTCATKQVCDGGDTGLSGSGKRDIQVTCCLQDLCNYPDFKAVTTAMPVTAAPTPGFPGDCTRDIIFVLDESSKMQSNESAVQAFVKGIVSNFDIGPQQNLVSVGTFSNSFSTQFHLTDHTDLTSLNQAIDNVHFRGGAGDNNAALNWVWRQGSSHTGGNRPSVPDVVIIVTDDLTHNHVREELLLNHVNSLSHDVITIGVGSHHNTTDLQHIATDYGHSFDIHNPTRLSRIEAKVVKLICTTTPTGPIVGK